MNPPSKILLALQFWEGDKAQAMKVARLIADLETRHSDHADFLFVSRFDCGHDKPTLDYVSRKFNTYSYVNRRRGQEWPHGCNSLWFGTMDYMFAMNAAKRLPTYKAILTFESDATPLAPNWISELSRAWDASQPTKVLGALQSSPGPHVNGNAMFSGDLKFLKYIARDVAGCSPQGGWDFMLAPVFKRLGWKNSNLFRSWWNHPSMSENVFCQLQREEVVFFHGVKDSSVIDLVRKRFL